MSTRTLRATRPNAGLKTIYRQKMQRMVRDMSASVEYWLVAAYRANTPEMAHDASPARELTARLKSVMRRWRRTFDQEAQKIGAWFGSRVDATTQASMKAALRDMGFTVQFRTTRAVNDVLQAVIQEQINLIKSIPTQYFTEVEGLVMRSVREGRALGFLKEELQKRYSITARRAITIARDQSDKATESLSRVRNKALGITHGRWIHTSGSKNPRSTHVHFNGQIFDLSKGLHDPEADMLVLPSSLVNCRCTYAPVIPDTWATQDKQ